MANPPLKEDNYKPKTINDARIDVDLCFVCDCTTTMSNEIKQVLEDITNLVATVASKLKAKLRVGFVAYRDYPVQNSPDPEARIECFDFTADLTEFINFLQPIQAMGGGGDQCEDVLGGLQSSLSLKWQSPTKVLFHICDDPPHGTAYHSFFEEISENEQQLMEFMKYDSETCQDIFGEDSWEFAWIFQHNEADKRQQAMEQYIKSRKDAKDRFPDKHSQDPDHRDILFQMKNRGIQYYIAKKTKNVDKMINVFKSTGLDIKYDVETSELTAASQLFGIVLHSISSAIMISKEVEHTQIIQQRARRLFLDSKVNNNNNNDIGHVFQVYCGIDFGTDGTAFSYCLPNDDEVYTPEWGDDRIVDIKLKTNILLNANKDYKCVAFGQRAREIYMKMENSDDDDDDDDEDEEDNNGGRRKDDLLFFEKFKMALYRLSKDAVNDIDDEKKEQHIHEQLTSINGERCESKTVIVEALKFVKNNALNAMQKKGLKVTVSDCQWVLTVPAIWSNRSKGIMIYCAQRAGLLNPNIPNHLIIAFEPDCASIAIQHEYIIQKKHRLERRTQKAMARKKKREQQKEIGKTTSIFGPKILGNDDNNDDISDDDWLSMSVSPRDNIIHRKKKKENIETQGCDDKNEEKQDISYNKDKRSAFNAHKQFFQRGEKYILADLGGGTADIACHEILSEYNVREIYRPSGGPFGSTYIDQEFIKLLNSIISKQWMKEFKINEPHIYVELLDHFQFSKVNFWKKRNVDGSIEGGDDKKQQSDHHNVKLPFDFLQFMEEKIQNIVDTDDEDNEVQELETLFDNYSNNEIEKGWLKLESQFLKIHNKVWQYLFDKVVIPILEHIENLMNKLSLKHQFKYLLLAGGFCESNYIKHRLLQRFGMKSKHKLRIVIPRRPILQVVTGAALYCKNQCYVRSRQIRNTIGIEIREKLYDFKYKYNQYKQSIVHNDEKDELLIYDDDNDDNDIDDEQRLLKIYENDEYIKKKIIRDKKLEQIFIDNVFHKFVSSGDELQIDDPPNIQYFKPVDKDSNEIEIKLYEFEENINNDIIKLFTDDNGCNVLATKKIKLPKEWVQKNDGSMDIPIAFFFGDTRIKVYIGIQGINQNDAEINLDYKYYDL